MIYLYIGIFLLLLFPIFLFLARKYMNRLVEKRIATYQNDLVARHCDEVENIYRQMRAWRHDYHNHIQTMKACLALDQKAELGAYLGKLDTDLTSVDTVIKTGNVMVDAILNSKISLAQSKKIAVNAKATVPKTLTVSDIDLCVIIGNLLDNAIEASVQHPEESKRFIRIYIGIHKEMFYISITNSVGGTVNKHKGEGFLPIYHSTKNQAGHGFGLVRIDKLVAKYDGFVDRQNEPGVFVTEIMLPL